jgi:hypothetical protein
MQPTRFLPDGLIFREIMLTGSSFGQNRSEVTDILREILRMFVTTLVNIIGTVALVTSVM